VNVRARVEWVAQPVVRLDADDVARLDLLRRDGEKDAEVLRRLLREAAEPTVAPSFETVVLRYRKATARLAEFRTWQTVGPLTPEDADQRAAQLQRQGWEVAAEQVEARPRVVTAEEPEEADEEHEDIPTPWRFHDERTSRRIREGAR
jgi:hypothetical protein